MEYFLACCSLHEFVMKQQTTGEHTWNMTVACVLLAVLHNTCFIDDSIF